MITISFSDDAKRLVQERAAAAGMVSPGVVIARESPRADVTRASDGEVTWRIDRPHPVSAKVTDLSRHELDPARDLITIDGILVFPLLMLRPSERELRVVVADGDLHVEVLDA